MRLQGNGKAPILGTYCSLKSRKAEKQKSRKAEKQKSRKAEKQESRKATG